MSTDSVNKKFSLLVGVVPLRGEEVLITQRSERETFMPGAWGLPSGKVDFGESLESAVHRELFEETSLYAESLQLIGHSLFMSRKDDLELHNLQVNFIAKVSSGKSVKLDHASQAFAWIPLELPIDHPLDPFTMNVIDQALTYIRSRVDDDI